MTPGCSSTSVRPSDSERRSRWAIRAGADRLHVVSDESGGVLARRAAEFEMPITIWAADGRALRRVTPEPLATPAPAPQSHEALRQLIIDGGAEPVVEHGVLTGEVRGLEVCRVVDDPDSGMTRLEVGVGAHDREAFQMLHGRRAGGRLARSCRRGRGAASVARKRRRIR